MENSIRILIYMHAFFGGVGLLTGFGSVIVKKGSVLHKKMGKLFSISMVISSLNSLPIAWMSNHKNIFLFLIGIFTIYLVLTGNRALKLKKEKYAGKIDLVISGSMIIFSCIMILIGTYRLLNSQSNSILFLFFGGTALFLSSKDFRFYKKLDKVKNVWLIAHTGKMIGALIASVTAFIVAGLQLDNLISWILPTLLGTIYIIYWNRKIA
ncbi:hypothetical protein NBT05_15835 [Aquimarina sp. ERC-38]|uniref:hypothetical protein n=1 Tax=Aquimarina sp. ERC-38 TaxID=2949996 RepID=UPI002246CE2E|nr:hypothetical protein [Aquimarina sp. ERC-38]UZO80412.1 hypothetical protein NBT05_15835 [Aquimarina sp. ERC-38]